MSTGFFPLGLVRVLGTILRPFLELEPSTPVSFHATGRGNPRLWASYYELLDKGEGDHQRAKVLELQDQPM